MRPDLRMSDFMQSGQGVRRHLDGCNFRFYSHYKLNKQRSDEVGYAQHDPCEFIEIINFAGERTPREVEDRDRRAYPEEYARFVERENAPASGLYLREWCMITPSALADIEAFGLTTVEQLADVGDDVLNKFQFVIEWNRKAKAWLKTAKSKQAEMAGLEEKHFKLLAAYESLKNQYTQALQRIEATEGGRLVA